MFGIGSTELLLIGVFALLVIGPKDLPRVMRTVGNWVGRARGVARNFQSGIDAMIREAELEEMEKKWRADNEAILRDYPAPPVLESNVEEAEQGPPDHAPELPFEEPVGPAKPQPELP